MSASTPLREDAPGDVTLLGRWQDDVILPPQPRMLLPCGHVLLTLVTELRQMAAKISDILADRRKGECYSIAIRSGRIDRRHSGNSLTLAEAAKSRRTVGANFFSRSHALRWLQIPLLRTKPITSLIAAAYWSPTWPNCSSKLKSRKIRSRMALALDKT